MKKPTKKALTVAGFAIVGTVATSAITLKKIRKNRKQQPPKEEAPDSETLFI